MEEGMYWERETAANADGKDNCAWLENVENETTPLNKLDFEEKRN